MVVVLTDKDLMSSSTDEMMAAMKRHFYNARFLRGLNGDSSLVRDCRLGYEPKIGERVFSVPEKLRRFSSLDRVALVTKDPGGNEKSQPHLVLVNMPIPFQEVLNAYPNSAIAGYLDNEEETERLRKQCGLENALFLGPYPENQRNCTRFDYSHLIWLGYKGIFTDENIDSLIAQSARKHILLAESSGDCAFCESPRYYASAQAQILGIKSQNKLCQEFPEDRLEVLFRFDPLAERVVDLRELPIFGKIGPICYQTLLYNWHKSLGKIIPEQRMCGARFKFTGPAVRKFQEDYRTLCGKYEIEYPKK